MDVADRARRQPAVTLALPSGEQAPIEPVTPAGMSTITMNSGCLPAVTHCSLIEENQLAPWESPTWDTANPLFSVEAVELFHVTDSTGRQGIA